MAAPVKQIKQIKASDNIKYDINAKYWNGKTGIKTINRISLYGSGDIPTCYPIADHSTEVGSFSIAPNTFHIWGVVSGSLTINLDTDGVQANYANEYIFQFKCGTNLTLGLPTGISWAFGITPDVSKSGRTYQISIINNLATLLWWEEE